MDWFLNIRDLRHEWVKENLTFRSQEAYFGLCEKFMLWLLLFCENIFSLLEKLWYSRLTESKEMYRSDKNILTQSWLWTHLSMFSFNLLQPGVAFLHSLKTSENLAVFCFQGV